MGAGLRALSPKKLGGEEGGMRPEVPAYWAGPLCPLGPQRELPTEGLSTSPANPLSRHRARA